jgi:hypothetical protein
MFDLEHLNLRQNKSFLIHMLHCIKLNKLDIFWLLHMKIGQSIPVLYKFRLNRTYKLFHFNKILHNKFLDVKMPNVIKFNRCSRLIYIHYINWNLINLLQHIQQHWIDHSNQICLNYKNYNLSSFTIPSCQISLFLCHNEVSIY